MKQYRNKQNKKTVENACSSVMEAFETVDLKEWVQFPPVGLESY